VAATENRKGALRAALTAACGMLGVVGAPARATEVQSGILGYTEPGRVSALEVLSDVKHEFSSGKVASFRFVYDVLSGSSANGGVPSLSPQTFTSPSRNGSYVVEAGETPLDSTFRDTRFAGSAGLTLPWGRLTTVALGLYGSTEHDYMSLGANAALTREFNRKNTTVSLRAARFEDTINPEGGIPVAMAPMPPPVPGGGDDKAEDDEDGEERPKSVTDLGLSLTQVLGRRTLLTLNYTNSRVDGYQTDPYKLITVVDGVTGAPRAASPYLYESRPDSRLKHAVAGELLQHLGRDVMTLAYRYFTDDWDIRSHTAELNYRLNFAANQHLQPNVRWYHQTEAEFYRRYLVDGEALPSYASADYRLGDMTAMTYGLKYGRKLDSGNEVSLRAEYYAQSGENHPADAIGDLGHLDMFPTVDAWIVNVGTTFGK
jgi:hypothetical protein